MAASDPSPGGQSDSKRRRLRFVGMVILATGLLAAGGLYWVRTRTPDMNDNISMLRFSQPQRRQMGQLYGGMGNFIEDLCDDLQRPGVQSLLIAGGCSLIAGGCFFFSRSPELDGEDFGRG